MLNLTYTIIVLYTLALLYITIFCILQLHLLKYYRQYKKNKVVLPPLKEGDYFPYVTIQLPVYNEMYVVERLIDNILKMDYPKDKFEVQVLDDSTDQTREIIANKVAEYQSKDFNIHHIHRVDRTGYKAGALKEGMKTAAGEYIAIFDADFMPEPDFLRRALPYFDSPEIGVVQTRWDHINEDYNIITKLQAFQLNVHFTVEQAGRAEAGYFLQFNGTAGIWRARTIENAGGWQADTLTEDLDLSYRAQLNGWKIKFVDDIVCPAELPAEMNGLKSQQFRWMKGGAENAVKLFNRILNSNLPTRIKVHSFFHLYSSGIFLLILFVGIASVPVLYFLDQLGIKATFLAFCLLGTVSVAAVYYEANVKTCWPAKHKLHMMKEFFKLFPTFMILSTGLSLHNSIAVLQGYVGKKSAFIRTPKFNIKDITDTFNTNQYIAAHKINWTTWFEGIFSLYFFTAVIGSYVIDNYSFLIFHTMLLVGYSVNCYYSFRHLSTK